MNRRAIIGSAVIGAAAAATAGIAGAADDKKDSAVGILAAHWRKSKALTLKVAEAMPAEDYDYKPFADARPFGGELQHLGQAEGYYLGRFGKSSAPAAPKNDTGKEATVKYLTAVFDWSISVVEQLTDADLTRSFAGRGPAMTGLDLLYEAMIHTAHTRGYAEMYLRNKGIVPPTYDV